MRKILSLITISLLVLFASCDMNQVPEFDDSNVFVAFDNAAMSVKESGKVLSVPVTLASINGVSETVEFTLLDGASDEGGNALAGVNYSLASESTTLTFTAEARTQYIDINIVDNPGVFTGDLRFSVQLADDGKVKPNAENICNVTIVDNDHPLAFILGSFTVSDALDGWDAAAVAPWELTVIKDKTDVTIVWIANIAGVGDGAGFYGVVNAEKTEIAMPLGQVSTTNTAGSNGDGKFSLHGFADGKHLKDGKLIIKISEDGKTLTFEKIGAACDAGGVGYYQKLIPGYHAIKN